MVAKIVLVDLHFDDRSVGVPSGAGVHPAERRPAIARQRQFGNRPRLQRRVSPQKFENPIVADHRMVAQIFVEQVGIAVIAGGQAGRLADRPDLAQRRAVLEGVAGAQQLAVGPAHVDELIGDEPLFGAEDVAGAQAPENPCGERIPGHAGRPVGIALVVGVAGIKPIARGDMLAKEASGAQLVHFGIFVIQRDARRNQVAHDHRFGAVAGDGALANRRIAAFERPGQTDQFARKDLLVLGREMLVHPIVDNRRRDHHPPRIARGIADLRQTIRFEQTACFVDGLARQPRVGAYQVLDRVPFHLELARGLGQRPHAVDRGLKSRIAKARFQFADMLRAQIEPRALLRRHGDRASFDHSPA
ncbi:MAG: hypothetical protein BWZ10_01584 [candidate division BRC1 bacterium ADurb.BinA364]|nr:MAG: hypothetical protein BWZ10_01584 [candidate division BRC1 bacterium ADurb.BinA364]